MTDPRTASDGQWTRPRQQKTNGHAKPNGHDHSGEAEDWSFAGLRPTLSYWLSREIAQRDNLLGELISTTSRMLLAGPTGQGKTNFCLALALAIAAGTDFLHWHAYRAARVLYVDGEMPGRLIKSRLGDAVRRARVESDNLLVLSRDDYPEMPPLNTPPGQAFMDKFIAWAGPLDLIFFDNLQALLTGDPKEPAQWAEIYPWTLDLTRRPIGQLYVHHTNAQGGSYGDRSRDWGMDTQLILEPVENPSVDISFKLTFPKARERTPDNRHDFEEALIKLGGDQWTSTRGGGVARRIGRPGKLEDIAMRALDEALAKAGTAPIGCASIPPDTLCVKRDLWAAYFRQTYVGESDPKSIDHGFRAQARKLQAAQRIGFFDPWVWRTRSGP
jgi:hypothetical protein